MTTFSFRGRNTLLSRLALYLIVLILSLWAVPALAANSTTPAASTSDFRRNQIAAAEFHTCVIDSNGGLKCWGDNAHGRLGDGTEENRATPAYVTGLTAGVTEVVAGEEYTCALIGQPGGVKCWGQRTKNGTDEDSSLPLDITGFTSGVTAIAGGTDHICALRDGGVHCWGLNRDGALGDGTTAHSPIPRAVIGLDSDVIQISAGNDHTCALLEDGSVQCWGRNNNGQLGTGDTSVHPAPVAASVLDGVEGEIVEVAAGSGYTCVRTSSGEVFCWGFGRGGQLGNGADEDSLVPVQVQNLSGEAIALNAGRGHACALLKDQTIQCWGNNQRGQLGTSCATGPQTQPLAPSRLPGRIVAMQAGWNHTCTLNAFGQLYCWGSNSRGQVGISNTGNAPLPVEVTVLTKTVRSLALGLDHSCALTEAGSVTCWGGNVQGQLGDSTGESCQTPVEVPGLQEHVTSLAAGANHTCALRQDPEDGESVRCWGDNQFGQLGNGGNDDQLSPVTVTLNISNVVRLVAGRDHTCALMEPEAGTYSMACWGSQAQNQIRPTMTITNGIENINTGSYLTCAIDPAGDLYCWGSRGLLIQPDLFKVEDLGGPASDVTGGISHTCALVEGGVRCWGVGQKGQLGAGESITSTVNPTDVIGLDTGVQAIDAGEEHTCSLRNGGVFCWGDNELGQLGNGSFGFSFEPVGVSGLASGVSAIYSGSQHTCAILDDGSVQCWGRRGSGALGDGESENILAPRCVDTLCEISVFLPTVEK